MNWGMDAKFKQSVVDAKFKQSVVHAKQEFDKYLLQRLPPDKDGIRTTARGCSITFTSQNPWLNKAQGLPIHWWSLFPY